METKAAPKPEPKKAGRPPAPKAGIELKVEGEFVVIRIPKKDVSRKLLAEFI